MTQSSRRWPRAFTEHDDRHRYKYQRISGSFRYYAWRQRI